MSGYIEAALAQAQYEILADEGGFYGSIPALAGVWAHADSLEECREELKSALEDWLLFSLSLRQATAALDGIDLTVREVA